MSQTGLSRDELLAGLSQHLPDVINQLDAARAAAEPKTKCRCRALDFGDTTRIRGAAGGTVFSVRTIAMLHVLIVASSPAFSRGSLSPGPNNPERISS